MTLTDAQQQALARAADRLRDWVGYRIDDRAEDIARLYRDSRATLATRLRHVYDSFLAGEPTVAKARSTGAAQALKAAIDATIDELTHEVGAEATTSLQSLLGGQPAAVNRYLGTYLDVAAADNAYALNPQWVLQELSTSVIGGGTYFDRLLGLGENMKADLTRIVRQGLISGADFDTVRDRAMTAYGIDTLPEPKFNAYGSVQIYKNEARRQWSLLMKDTAEEVGARQVWWATLDERTTPGCAARHGHEILSDSPPRHYNCRCVPVGTVVEGSVIAGTKMLYAGQVRKIKTAAGHVLTVTPNHPIPTLAGWKAAHAITEQDYVVSYGRWIKEDSVRRAPTLGKTFGFPDDNQHGPALIEDVFETIRCVGGASRRVGRVSHDFDGDAAAGQSDIEIVAVHGVLLKDGAERGAQGGDRLVFHATDLAYSVHAGEGDCTLVAQGFGHAGHRTQAGLDRGLYVPSEAPPQPRRFGLPTELNAVLEEMALQGAVRQPGFVHELVERCPGAVTLDQVVEIWNEEFRGHVYDLQSTSGVFVASNVLISNCQIAAMPSDADLTEFQQAGTAWLTAHGYPSRKRALALEAWNPAEHPREKKSKAKEAWSPEDHPRDPNGRFSASGAPALHTIHEWVTDAGAVFNGVQAFPGRPDYAAFTDRTTGSTMMLPIDKDLTPETIKQRIEQKRKEFHKEAEPVQWGRATLVRLACEEADTVQAWDDAFRGAAAWRYLPVPWRALPALVRTGVNGAPSAPSLLEAYRRSDPACVVLRFPQAPGRTPPQRVQVLAETGWTPLQPAKAAWMEVAPGAWVPDAPDAPRWREAAVRFSADVIERFPQLGGLALRAAGPYRAAVQPGSPVGLDPETWTPATDPGRSLPAVVDAVLAGPVPPGALLGIWDRNGLAVITGLTGRVWYARDPFNGLGLSTYTRVAAYCPGDAPGTVWAVKPADHGQWVLPGGHIDPGESKTDAVVREMREETGLHVEVVRYLGAIHRPWATTHVYLVRSSEHGQDPNSEEEWKVVSADDLDPSERVWLVQQDVTMEAWDPAEHPRDDEGQFADVGGGPTPTKPPARARTIPKHDPLTGHVLSMLDPITGDTFYYAGGGHEKPGAMVQSSSGWVRDRSKARGFKSDQDAQEWAERVKRNERQRKFDIQGPIK